MKKKWNCLLIVLLLLLNNCSYQKINSSNQDFYINEITISGEKRAAFLIKKKLKNNFVKSGANPLNIIIDLKKTKDVAEKNLQNKVTKYQLGLKAQTVVRNKDGDESIAKLYSNDFVYEVVKRYADTKENEKNAYNTLIDQTVDQIMEDLKIKFK
jgi:hypothetical protein|tara:strand:+ start:4740 stop:5204 length:465 start_codon:yes stop_codon:yes gene_type:complete